MHDIELTYSIVLPGEHPLAARRDELYQAVHGCLIEVFRQFGVTARLAGGKSAVDKTAAAREPFLCFQRRSPGDVLIGQSKVCGSAQRRRNGAVLQHGSLVWQKSTATPELPGVVDIVDHPLDLESVADLWLDTVGRRLGIGWEEDELDENEVRLASALVETRYACDDWTEKRGRSAFCGQDSL